MCPVIHFSLNFPFSLTCPAVRFFLPFTSPFCSFLSVFSQYDILGELCIGQLAVSHPSSQQVIGKPHKKLLLDISPPSYLQGVHRCPCWVSVKCYQHMLMIISTAIALLCWRLQTGIHPLLILLAVLCIHFSHRDVSQKMKCSSFGWISLDLSSEGLSLSYSYSFVKLIIAQNLCAIHGNGLSSRFQLFRNGKDLLDPWVAS